MTVGSNSNAAENGIDQEIGRAAIWEVDLKHKSYRIYASGLRNPNGLAWKPEGSALWTVVNERDEIGSDLVPDYLTSVSDGSFLAGPIVILAGIWTNVCSLNDLTWLPRQGCRVMRSGRIRLHSAWHMLKTLFGQSHLTTVCSSASTVRGTENHAVATGWSLSLSGQASPSGNRSMC